MICEPSYPMAPGTSQASYPLSVLYTQAADAARAGARNLYFATKFVPPDLARSAYAVYWFCEHTRGLVYQAESEAHGHAKLDRWASLVTTGLRGQLARNPVLDVFLDTAARCGITAEQPLQLIEGYRTELARPRFDSFQPLAGHCRRTGGMISLMMTQVVGYRDPAPDYMTNLGVAVALTTNLRDLGRHLSHGYAAIPLEEMRAFAYTEADLEARVRNTAFQNLMRYQAARIETYFQKAEPGLALLHSQGRFAVRVAFDLYRQTLRRMEASGFDVFRKPAAVPAMSRYWITARSMAGPITRRLWKGRSA